MWSAWSSGRRSGGCTGLSGCRFGRSASGRGCIARRSAGRSRHRCRRSIERAPAGSKLDPFKDWICERLLRIRRSSRSGSGSSRPSLAIRAGSRSLMTSSARSARGSWRRERFSELCIGRASWFSAICGSRESCIPVGYGQLRRGWVVTCEVCWSRAIAGTLVFSKEAPDILFGPRSEPRQVAGAAGEAGLGPRVSDRRGRPTRPRSSPRSAVSSSWAG